MEYLKNRYLWFLPAYLLITGILFIWGYWNSFKINAFEYASINEAIMASLIPISSTLIAVIIGALIGTYGSHKDTQSIATSGQSQINKMSRMDWAVFILIYVPVIIYLVITDNEGLKWIMSALILSAIPSTVLLKNDFLSDIYPLFIRGFFAYMLCLTPALSFAIGKNEALKVLNNKEYKYIQLNEITYKYIGFLHGKTFFTNISNEEILILQDTEYKSITLKIHLKK